MIIRLTPFPAIPRLGPREPTRPFSVAGDDGKVPATFFCFAGHPDNEPEPSRCLPRNGPGAAPRLSASVLSVYHPSAIELIPVLGRTTTFLSPSPPARMQTGAKGASLRLCAYAARLTAASQTSKGLGRQVLCAGCGVAGSMMSHHRSWRMHVGAQFNSREFPPLLLLGWNRAWVLATVLSLVSYALDVAPAVLARRWPCHLPAIPWGVRRGGDLQALAH